MDRTVNAQISEVTVLEDRAVVERRATVALDAGDHRIAIEGLPAVAVDRTLQASADRDGRVLDAKLSRVWRRKHERPDDQRDVARHVDALERDLARAQFEARRAATRVRLATVARDDVVRHIRESAGAGAGDSRQWSARYEEAEQYLARAVAGRRETARDVKVTADRLAEARDAAERTSSRGVEELTTTAHLTIRSPGATHEIVLRHLVPCAAWRPAYRATLHDDAITLQTDAVVWQRTGEEWADARLRFSTARSTLGASPPTLTADRLALRERTQQERREIDVAVREEEIQVAGEGGAPRTVRDEMPGLDDGGDALTLAAPHRATVASDGEPHRIPLATLRADAESELQAAPEHSPLVHRVARFVNTGPVPLLAGPVDLVRTSGYVGRGRMRFAAPGERVKLSFGSEDALRIARRTERREDEQRVTGRRTVTHTTTLYVSNAGDRPVHIAVDERIPVSEVAAVEVRLLPDRCRPGPPTVDADGIVRFAVDAPPGSQQELTLAWATVAGGKVTGL